MSWTNSKVFIHTMEDALENTVALDADTDTFKAALYNNSITPDQNVASASTAYNAGVWGVANEQTDTNWPAGGRPLSVTSSAASGVYTFDSTDTAGAGNVTLANVYGCLVYDDSMTSPADQGWCYNYFGGVQSVTAGTFTIVWHTNGVMNLTF